MRTLFTFGLTISILFGLTPAFGADAAAGKAVFSKKCASCHGANGEGNQTIANALKVQLRPLGSADVQSSTDAQLKKIILEGKDKMKPVKDVDTKSADDVVAYLRTLKK